MKLKINKKKVRKISPTDNAFLSLAGSIISQQISTKAGNAIRTKFLLLFRKRKITPDNFLKLNISELRRAGVSPQKAGYLKDLAEKFLDKTIDHKNFHKMTDAEVKEHLVQVKGIGPWTADMFLIFALNRKDILPVGDLGTKKGFQKAFKLKNLPTERHMRKLARPHNGELTTLTLYLWDILDENKK
ncbi:MAG TPA: DNA-3-methyladenine glycosylase 2 family protein [Candidatus Paceibacterota bacterium]|jgi:DNA-3-methyladenine glycosylase II|nr:DNA-3-methyladenine glycosylase 2 family protein [Candidatus Paceibacterota bacterium]